VGEPPVLFEEDIFQNEASKIFARSGLKATTGSPEMAIYSCNMSNYDALPGYRYIYLKNR